MISAAGILFTTGRYALFLLRGNGGDHPNEWCIPGGKAEDEDESLMATAIRETLEECGYHAVPAELAPWTRRIAPPLKPDDESVDFSSFLCRIEEPFIPTLCEEHDGYAWAPLDKPPEPLHPGVRVALARFSMVEIDVARAMAAGELVSPQTYETITLFAIRITGTGKSFRPAYDEHVWRDPELYLNDEFLARCQGLPVIFEHPQKKGVIDSKEFNRRIVGTVIHPYIKGDEVWGIARIMDDQTIALMGAEQVSTSPGVTFDSRSECIEGVAGDGKSVLIEGKPSLIDHIAICAKGVWDKGGPPEGVDRTGAVVVTDSVDETSLDYFMNSLTLLSVRVDNLGRS